MTAVVPTRELGTSGLVVGALGLGCAPMSNSYGPASDDESIATIRRAVELGYTLLDTAESYGPPTAALHHNETLVGRAIKGIREDVALSSKFGISLDRDFRLIVDGRAEKVRSSCEGSLRRLGTDHLDLYYLHRPDPAVPIEDTVGAMAELVAAGKVLHLGLCEVDVETLERAAAVHPIAAVESEWSMWTRSIETAVLPAARRLGIGIIPYAPLGRGMFTGTITAEKDLHERDFRRSLPRFSGENLASNLTVVAHLRQFAEERGCSLPQLALAWLLAQGPDVVPIPGGERRQYVEENARAATLELDADAVDHLEAVLAAEAFAGDRYPDGSYSAS